MGCPCLKMGCILLSKQYSHSPAPLFFDPRHKISTNMLSSLGGVSVKILGGRMLCAFYWKTNCFEQNLSRVLSQFCVRYWKSGKEPQEKRHRQKRLRETSDITSFRPLNVSLKNNLAKRSSQTYHRPLSQVGAA